MPLPTELASHWRPRPGRTPGRELYHWHLLYHDQPAIGELAAWAQAKLTGQPLLDLIEPQWLHTTALTTGFADEVPDAAVDTMVRRASDRLAAVPPIPVTIGRLIYVPDAVVALIEPLGALQPILRALRAAAADAGCASHTDTDPWIPHISIAYANDVGPASPVIAALGKWLPLTSISIRSASLVAQTQVGRSWQWRPVAEVALAGPAVTHGM